jgi:hypothetical protein
MDLLASFDRFGFWPDATEGIFVVADQRATAFSEAEKSQIAAMVAKVEGLAGALPYYRCVRGGSSRVCGCFGCRAAAGIGVGQGVRAVLGIDGRSPPAPPSLPPPPREGHKDPGHFHGPGWGEYNLYVMRDELVPQYYKPSDIRVLRQ